MLQEAGLKPIRFHDLRATYASILANKGLPPKVLQRLLGHSHFAVTMDIYARFSRDEGLELTRAIASLGAQSGKMLVQKKE